MGMNSTHNSNWQRRQDLTTARGTLITPLGVCVVSETLPLPFSSF